MRIVNVFLWLPINISLKIVNSGLSLLNLEPKVSECATPRRRPLHTCGASCLAIAHKGCTKVQDCDGPLGTIAKRAVTVFNSFFPFVYTVLYQWLALLSFMDDQILNVEGIVETIIPPSKGLFDKIDELVCSAESLPQHFDEFLTKFATMVHQSPFLDSLLARLISWLNFIISVLIHLGSKNTKVKEIRVVDKGIQVTPSPDEKSLQISDSNCEVVEKPVKRLHSLKNRIKALEIEPRGYGSAHSPMYCSYESAKSSPVSDWSDCSPDAMMNCSYKEILEKGKNDDIENNEDNVINQEKVEVAQR